MMAKDKGKPETNIIVFGKPFSGVNTVADLIVRYGISFSKIDLDFLINGFYNDFKCINKHEGQLRLLIRSSTILKNAAFLYRAIGVPEYLSTNKMYEWTKCFDEKMHPILIKRKIFNDMNELYPLWRKQFAREKMIESVQKNHVIIHPYTIEEATVEGSDYIKLWIDASDSTCLVHGQLSKKVEVFCQDVLDDKADSFIRKLSSQADFKITNNSSKEMLAEQVCSLMNLLGCLKGTVRIGTANGKQTKPKRD